MRYMFLVHHGMRELQALVTILHWRHDQWIRSLMQFLPMSHEVLVWSGVDPTMCKGNVVANDISNDIDDADIPSVDI